MPKTGAPITHDAIKRSLKSKFKLILSENKILVETINGYVRKAEKVYKEMESTDDVTPKQFAKAMEKLERAYSACVRLIMVASDLFEKGELDVSRTRETTTSSCDSDTSSVFSSESSTTVTDTNRTRKSSNEKSSHRRSKSSDVCVSDTLKPKPRSLPAHNKGQTIELAETAMVEAKNMASERLFVRSGSNSDFDHLIELQRFLHGLEKEKLQTDRPSPCVAADKMVATYMTRSDKLTSVSQTDVENKQVSPEVSSSQSLTQRLKILKSAIEHFKDRSVGDDRVTNALNDIRELVLKVKEPPKETIIRASETMSEEGYISPVLESYNEVQSDKDNQVCGKENVDRADNVQEPQASKQRCNSSHEKKSRDSPVNSGKLRQENPKEKTEKSPIASEKIKKMNSSQPQELSLDQQNKTEYPQQMKCNDAKPSSAHESRMSPAVSPLVSDDDKEDINQIIVNRIVDMVSAKLAPRLQMQNSEDGSGFPLFRPINSHDNNALDDSALYQQRVRSPTHTGFKEADYHQTQPIGNFCGNYNQLSRQRHHHYQQQLGQQQQELQKLSRQQQRPKMVSFVDDYEDCLHYNTWNSRTQNDSRTYPREISPIHMSGQMKYEDHQAELQQSYPSQPNNRYSNPHRKMMHVSQLPHPVQRHTEQLHQQCLPLMRVPLEETEYADGVENEGDHYKEDDEESEPVNESDFEVTKEHLQYQSQDLRSKSVPNNESLARRNRSLQKSPPSIEAEYRALHHMRHEKMCKKQQMLHKCNAYAHRSSLRSPDVEIRQISLNDQQQREWQPSPPHAAESRSLESDRIESSDGDAVNRVQYRYAEPSSDQRQGKFAEYQSSPTDEHFTTTSEWTQIAPSTNTALVLPQQPTESARLIPNKTPRSGTQQQQDPNGCYGNFVGNKNVYTKNRINDATCHTSESSCEPSPSFSPDDRLQVDESTTAREETEVNDSNKVQPELVCIDATQLNADASRTITLSNLPLNLDETELLNIFKQYGHVTKVYYIKDRNTGLFQGRAYGKFSKASEAYQAAQELQKLVIYGQEISVQLYVSAP